MTKAELIEAMKDMPDDMELRLGVPGCESEYEIDDLRWREYYV